MLDRRFDVVGEIKGHSQALSKPPDRNPVYRYISLSHIIFAKRTGPSIAPFFCYDSKFIEAP
jgi:hypothetical protein